MNKAELAKQAAAELLDLDRRQKADQAARAEVVRLIEDHQHQRFTGAPVGPWIDGLLYRHVQYMTPEEINAYRDQVNHLIERGPDHV